MGKGKAKGKQSTVFEVEKYHNQMVHVKFTGGREVKGILKGFDPVVNVVLDEAEEFRRDPKDPTRVLEETRKLGLIVCRGPSVTLISPLPQVISQEELMKAAENNA